MKERKQLPKFTDRYHLGDQGLQVSPFCVGMVRDPNAVPEAFDAGINFFFVSADMHWPYYEGIRQGIEKLLARGKSIREKIVVGVVCYLTQLEFCTAPYEEVVEFVKGLKTIDLLIIGGCYSGEFLNRLHYYRQLRKENFLESRALGATFHDRRAGLEATNHHLLDISFIRYNPLHSGARVDLFPDLAEKKTTLLYNFKSTWGNVSPQLIDQLGVPGDYWRPSITDYYRFALSRPEINGLLCSPKTPFELKALAQAIEEGPLSESEQEYLLNLSLLASGQAVPDVEPAAPISQKGAEVARVKDAPSGLPG